MSRTAADVQSTLAIEKTVVDVPDSPKKKKRPAEGAGPSSSKKRRLVEKSGASLKMMDSNDIDDAVDEIDLQASDDVRFPRSKDVRFVDFRVSYIFCLCSKITKLFYLIHSNSFFVHFTAYSQKPGCDSAPILEGAGQEGQPRR